MKRSAQSQQPAPSSSCAGTPVMAAATAAAAHGAAAAQLEAELQQHTQAPASKRARLSGSLDVVLSDADAALHLSARACAVATHLCARSSDAAERVLSLAEAALAATMTQLAHAQDLVATQLMAAAAAQQQQQQEHGAEGGDEGALPHVVAVPRKHAVVDPELQDTCSSSFSGMTTCTVA